MLAHGLVVQAGLALVEENHGEDHQGKGQVYHGGLVEEQGTDEGDVLQNGDAHAGHQGDLHQAAARAEVHPVNEGCQGRGQQVHRHAVNRVVGAEGNGGKGVNHVHQRTRQGAAEDAQPHVARGEGQHEASKGSHGGQALQADVDHAGPLGIELRHGDKQQGHRHADGRQNDTAHKRAVHAF